MDVIDEWIYRNGDDYAVFVFAQYSRYIDESIEGGFIDDEVFYRCV